MYPVTSSASVFSQQFSIKKISKKRIQTKPRFNLFQRRRRPLRLREATVSEMRMFFFSPARHYNISFPLPGAQLLQEESFTTRRQQSRRAYRSPAWDNRNRAGSETTVSSQVFKHRADYRYKLAEKWKKSRVGRVHAT